MVSEYQLDLVPRIVFGWGELRRLPELAAPFLGNAAGGYALVTGPSAHNEARIRQAQELLGPAQLVFRDLRPEPTLADVDRLLAHLRSRRPALVIGIGGGSALDVAKAAAALAPAEGDAADYFYGRRQVQAPGIPCIAVPTTAGTGTEMTRNSVLVDEATRVKQSIRHRYLIPVAALVDPELTVTVPPAVTAASGLDALTQAIESYLSTRANHVTRALAGRAVGLLRNAVVPAWRNGRDREARTAMAEGSMLTGLAFAHSGLGAVHGLAHPLGSLLHLPHGYTCAVLLPHVLQYNEPACARELAELAQVCGLNGAGAFVADVAGLCRTLGLPRALGGDGLREEHFAFVLANCRVGSMKTNPREMSDADVVQVLRDLL